MRVYTQGYVQVCKLESKENKQEVSQASIANKERYMKYLPLFIALLNFNLQATPVEVESLPSRSRHFIDRSETDNLRYQMEGDEVSGLQLAKAAKTPVVVPVHTSHQGAIHNLIAVDAQNQWLQIDDASSWYVKPTQARKTAKWNIGDPVILTQNHLPFSKFEYCATNLNKAETVEVKIKGLPDTKDSHTRSIQAIDPVSKTLTLNDGTKWKLESLDYQVYKDWAPNDVVILGINDSIWSKVSYPNLLINVVTYEYIVGCSEN